jgi:carbonyl reductase 1
MAFSSSKWWSNQSVAVVTGSNRGIGLEISRNLAKEGLTTIMAARNAADGEAAKKMVDEEVRKAASGGKVLFHQLDISDKSSVEEFAAWVKASFPEGLSILVNNAGMAYKGDAFGADECQITLETNLFGTVAITRALLPLMQDKGRIINVSSRAGRISIVPSQELRERIKSFKTEAEIFALADDFVSSIRAGKHEQRGFPSSMYGVSKLLLSSHTQLLARELEGKGISVAACCPGWCKTGMSSWSGNKTASEGADAPTWLALTDDPVVSSGKFWAERKDIPY